MSVPVVAVDLGATSVRVARVILDVDTVTVDVVHRHPHGPVADARGTLRWDWDGILAAVTIGIDRALDRGSVVSIGVDAWGVDYGLLGRDGRLLSPPISYRDGRTADYRMTIDRIGARRLYEISGLQEGPINTLFQLAVHDPEELAAAAHVLMLPELVVHHLTGTVTGERTSAGTTGLLDLATASWSEELAATIGLDAALLPVLAEPGTPVGTYRDVPVHLVGGHDTASAVVAGGAEGAAFVSTGTWLLVGCERPTPDTSSEARSAGFANEQGTFGGIRFLRNVAGWWLIEECRREWGTVSAVDLVDAAANVPSPPRSFDATDDRFLAPASMVAEICDASGLAVDAPPPAVVRAALESMTATVASVVERLPACSSVRAFGGGAQSALFVDLLAEKVGIPVSVGAAEATAVGNALTQGVALGAYESPAAARAAVPV
ncbi:MAG: rhamnulokinase [Acidimicrobiia bacterium]